MTRDVLADLRSKYEAAVDEIATSQMRVKWLDWTGAIQERGLALLDVAERARNVSLSGVEQDDPRLHYVVVQVTRSDWDALRAALDRLEGRDG